LESSGEYFLLLLLFCLVPKVAKVEFNIKTIRYKSFILLMLKIGKLIPKRLKKLNINEEINFRCNAG